MKTSYPYPRTSGRGAFGTLLLCAYHHPRCLVERECQLGDVLQLDRRQFQHQYVRQILLLKVAAIIDRMDRWMIVSSMIQLGLSWWQAWICVWVGYGIVAPFIVANARPGAIFHVTFPVVARTSFGLWGSLWCVFNRGAMAWCVYIFL